MVVVGIEGRPVTQAQLQVFPNNFLALPLGGNVQMALYIDRINNFARMDAASSFSSAAPQQEFEIYGIVGVVPLVLGNYLVVITERERECTVDGIEIWRIKRLRWLPFASEASESKEKIEENDYVLALVQGYMEQTPLFYSDTLDITRNAQSSNQWENENGLETSIALCQRVDRRFVFNAFMCEIFVRSNITQWILPIMTGSFQTRKITVNGMAVTIQIISRAATQRLGTRLTRRGCDNQGNAANFVETEQRVVVGDRSYSYVQCRGSVPILWRQPANLMGSPKVIIESTQQSFAACKKHVEQLIAQYKSVSVVNLLNRKHKEGDLEQNYAQCIEDCKLLFGEDKLRYISYEVNKSAGPSFSNVHSFVSLIHEDIQKFGYFMQQGSRVRHMQNGIFRVNCLDSVDRTNLIQSVIGEEILTLQLRSEALIGISEIVGKVAQVAVPFRKVWAHNGNACGYIYTRTIAMRGSVVAKRRLSFSGRFKDAMISVYRWYLCNFVLGTTQDAIDILMGAASIQGVKLLAAKNNKPNRLLNKITQLVLFLGFFMLCLSIIGPESIFSRRSRNINVIAWLSLLLIALTYVFTHGRDYVVKPVLIRD